MRKILLGSAALCMLAGAAWAADAPEPGTVVTGEDLQKILQSGNGVQENMIKMYNMGMGNQMSANIIHRTSTAGVRRAEPTGAAPAAPPRNRAPTTPCGATAAPAGAKISDGTVLVHDDISEVYYILKGTGTMVVGGTVFNGQHATDSKTIGPTCSGKVYGDFKIINVKPGDMVVLPQGMAHSFSDIPDAIDYINLRIDPKHVLPSDSISSVLK